MRRLGYVLSAGTLVVSLMLVSGCSAQPQLPPASAPPQRERAPSTSARFDFYVLAMSWSPQHCASRGNNSRNRNDIQCAGEREYDFVLHGLWPQYEKGWPQDCSTEQVPRSTVDRMLDIMPSPSLVRHEWSKHGTCSGLPAGEYFAKARQAFEKMRIPQQYQRPRLEVVSRPKELKRRFVEANPSFPENSLAVVCSGRFLQEVRACLTTDFQPRACSAEVLRNQCRTDEIILRPVR